MSPFTLEPDMNGDGLHIGIVRARFNEEIGLIELDTCLQELEALGVDERNIMVITVPGALELGVTLARMAESYEFDALIALGAVIRGETYHFEIVSNESASAIARVALETGIPVANGVLTTETDEQAEERAQSGGDGHHGGQRGAAAFGQIGGNGHEGDDQDQARDAGESQGRLRE